MKRRKEYAKENAYKSYFCYEVIIHNISNSLFLKIDCLFLKIDWLLMLTRKHNYDPLTRKHN